VAIETAPVFATTTVNGYTVRTTAASTDLSVSTNSLASPIILPSADAIENKKIIMGVEITAAYSDVAARLILEGSHNGTDWITITSIDTDTEPNTVEVKPYFVDLTDVYIPNFRLHFNSTNTSVGTTGNLKFFFAYI